MELDNNALYFELTTPVDDERPVFLAGNFSQWYPDVKQFELKKVAPGKFILPFPTNLPLPDHIEYKYTRGAWDDVELDPYGNAPSNRISRRKSGVRKDFVPHWRKDGAAYEENLILHHPKLHEYICTRCGRAMVNW